MGEHLQVVEDHQGGCSISWMDVSCWIYMDLDEDSDQWVISRILIHLINGIYTHSFQKVHLSFLLGAFCDSLVFYQKWLFV